MIKFIYADQTDFTPRPTTTKWDAEALISFDENTLILFTKNWVDGVTKAYPIPKATGFYKAHPLPSTLQSKGRITGATYNPLTDKVYLVGYTPLMQAFVWVSSDFQGKDIFSGENTQTIISQLGFDQVEAIASVGPNRYFMTSEAFGAPPLMNIAKLVSFTTADEVTTSGDLY
jgi:hypothetical protein